MPILLVDDEPDYLTITSLALSQRGFTVTTAASGVEALALADECSFDLAIVDVVMSGMDGLELLSCLRVQSSDLPVILCTGHATMERAVEGFRRGAADFVRKLDGTEVLVAAIRRVLVAGRGPQVLQVKDLTLNLVARRVWRGDEEICLTKLEFDLLAYLARNNGRAVNYSELLTEVWEYPLSDGDPTQVRMAICRLRRKLKEKPWRKSIVTIRGVGFRVDLK